MAEMQAVRIHGYGGPEVLVTETAPIPSAGEGEVLVRLDATSVNPFDAALRAGYLAGFFTPNFPLILGTDIAGTIEEVGPGVEGLATGDVVYGRGGVFRDGSYAELAIVPASDVTKPPQSIDTLTAAAIPHVTLTAWQALIVAGEIAEGDNVLIHGAGGGVGHIAVQIAKWKGARVFGTASRNIDFARSLGVDKVVDYSTTAFEDELGDMDIVLDTVGGDVQKRSWQTLRPGGILVSVIEPPDPDSSGVEDVRGAMVQTAPPIGPTLAEVAKLIDDGTIKVEVSEVLPLADVRRGHEMIEGRHTRGKIVIQI